MDSSCLIAMAEVPSSGEFNLLIGRDPVNGFGGSNDRAHRGCSWKQFLEDGYCSWCRAIVGHYWPLPLLSRKGLRSNFGLVLLHEAPLKLIRGRGEFSLRPQWAPSGPAISWEGSGSQSAPGTSGPLGFQCWRACKLSGLIICIRLESNSYSVFAVADFVGKQR